MRIHRAHLEEDAAKREHASASGRIHGAERSLVDFNSCGTPLVELVTEPDLHSTEQTRQWLTLLRDAEGTGRLGRRHAAGIAPRRRNVSLRPAGSSGLGTKTELKNMNSFRFLERGIAAEVERQIQLLQAGEEVVQETLHVDPTPGRLTPFRSKEEAYDYRYFPEPDLMPIEVSDEMLASAQAALPELPADRAERFGSRLGLPADRARELAIRTELGDYFERAFEFLDGCAGPSASELANWIPQLVERIGADTDPAASRVSPETFATLVRMVHAKEVSRDAARDA